MNYKNILLGSVLLLTACHTEKKVVETKPYLRWVGDIEHDKKEDKADFFLCHEQGAYQYFNFSEGLQYEGEKRAIENAYSKHYRPVTNNQQKGLLRIRFLVNCKGDTDRFRIIGMDENYQPQVFDKAITNQLIDIAKQLDGWKVLYDRDAPRDYYQYLIFKLENGVIKEILP